MTRRQIPDTARAREHPLWWVEIPVCPGAVTKQRVEHNRSTQEYLPHRVLQQPPEPVPDTDPDLVCIRPNTIASGIAWRQRCVRRKEIGHGHGDQRIESDDPCRNVRALAFSTSPAGNSKRSQRHMRYAARGVDNSSSTCSISSALDVCGRLGPDPVNRLIMLSL